MRDAQQRDDMALVSIELRFTAEMMPIPTPTVTPMITPRTTTSMVAGSR